MVELIEPDTIICDPLDLRGTRIMCIMTYMYTCLQYIVQLDQERTRTGG